MSQRFASGARRLAGLACRTLGWRPNDFWNATPAELAAIFGGDDSGEALPLSRHDLEHLMERDRDG